MTDRTDMTEKLNRYDKKKLNKDMTKIRIAQQTQQRNTGTSQKTRKKK